MNVFDIITKYDSLIEAIEENGGEITPELAEQLNINANDLRDKIKAYYYIIKQKEADIQLAKDEQQRLSDVRKAKEGVIKRLKKSVDIALEAFGIMKPSGAKGLDLGDLKVWQKKTEALEIVEGAVIDDARFCTKQIVFDLSYEDAEKLTTAINGTEYKNRYSETIKLNNAKLKDWLKENEHYIKDLKEEIEEDALNLGKEEFESSRYTDEDRAEIIQESIDRITDYRISLAATIKRNSTVIFK